MDLAVSTRANMRRVFETMFFDRGFVNDDLVDFAYSRHLERGDHYTIKCLLEALASPAEKIDSELGQIGAPTLILWGENDAITPVAMGRAFQRGIWASRLETISTCGHLPCLEKPADFVKAVSAFIQ